MLPRVSALFVFKHEIKSIRLASAYNTNHFNFLIKNKMKQVFQFGARFIIDRSPAGQRGKVRLESTQGSKLNVENYRCHILIPPSGPLKGLASAAITDSKYNKDAASAILFKVMRCYTSITVCNFFI